MERAREQVTGFTTLDRAYGKRLAKDSEGALRAAAAILAAHPEDLGAALLLCRVLVDADRVAVAGQALEVLVDAMARRGDLAGAVVAARLADEAGGFAAGSLPKLAALFCKEAPRSGSGSMRPPPFPAYSEVTPTYENLHGQALFGAAEHVLSAFIAHHGHDAAAAEAPLLPLFGDLPQDALLQLLRALEIRELPADASAVSEGTAGDEAFVVARGLLNVVRGEMHTRLASLGPGAIFGEMALVSDSTRAASVVAVEPAILLVLSRNDLDTLSQLTPHLGQQLGQFCYDRMLVNLMRHSPVFASLDAPEQHELLSRFVVRHYIDDELLLQEGENNARLCVIASGDVEVLRNDADGESLRLARLGPGAVVGEMSLVLRRPISANVRARSKTVTLELTAEDFQQALKDYPALLSELYTLATSRDDETRSVLAQPTLDVGDAILL